MSADTISNQQTANASTESKSARKKKAKAEAAASTVAVPTPEPRSDTPSHDPKLNGTDGSSESPYIKELQKNIRNINKKLSSMQKVDAVLAEHPDTPLDELVASRKINNDQKAQALKKPALQVQLTQLEEQLSQYRKIDQEYAQRVEAEKKILAGTHAEELEKLRTTLKEEAAIEQQKAFKQRLLVLSRFLRAAAARRQQEDDESEETKAFEGALLLVYGGDPSAVAAAEKLIDGAEESVPSTEGTLLSVTYAQVKRSALADAPFAAEEAWVDDVAAAKPAPPEGGQEPIAGSDPTIANAGLTEQDEVAQITNGVTAVNTSATEAPPAASTGDEAANAAGESQWDSKAQDQDPLAESFEMVPRDPTETETPAPPPPANRTQSWADEVPPELEASLNAANGNDGFHEVHHHRGGRGRGGPQGESRGNYRGGRGRGGDGRGRGRGGFRGDRGGPRGGGFRGGRGRGDSQQ